MPPHPRYPHVFRPIAIGGTTLRNRIFVPAHTTNFGEDNLPSARHLAYHRARAAGGAALIIFEGIRVHPTSLGRRQGVNGYEPAAIDAFAPIARAVQAEGARLFGQIIHLGRHIDGNFTRTPSWSASAVPWSATAPPPHPMSTGEIAEVVEGHALVAQNLLAAGLDGIELQMAHGHLLQQFLSPASNRRTDHYGGSLANRLRFPLETLVRVREAVGNAPLGIRISADEFLEGGLTVADMGEIAVRLCRAARVDFVNVSHSAYHASHTVSTQMADMAFSRRDFQPLTRAIGEALAVLPDPPVLMTVCRYQTIAHAEEALAGGLGDMVGMARAHIADPAIVAKAEAGREADTTPCIACNEGCAGRLAQSLAITCLANPRAGLEDEWAPLPDPAAERRRVLVVGGGPAGLEAAAVAAARGHEVTLWEREARLFGTLGLTGAMPLRHEFMKLRDSLLRRIEAGGVDVRLGRAADADAIAAFGADAVVLATGAEPAGQPLGTRTAITLHAALADPDALGREVVVVDHLGTWAVVSVAEHLADLGKQVVLVAPTGTPGWTIPMYSAFALRTRLRQKRVRVIGGHAVTGHAGGEARLVDLSLPEREVAIPADSVVAPLPGIARDGLVAALGSRPDTPTPISVGDCQSPRTALEAIYEGHRAGRRV